jgi:nucleotide-binding universal stress UspA family protein
MIKKILVPVDGSNHARKAIEFACDIACKHESTIYLVHVVEIILSRRAPFQKAMEEHLTKTGQKVLEQAERKVREIGVENVQSALLKGSPARQILQFAKGKRVDMIVMGRRGLGALKDLFVGSVSHKVCYLAHCTCVMVT